MLSVLLVALKALLWALAGAGMLLGLVLILSAAVLCVSFGVRITDAGNGVSAALKVGFFSFRLTGRKPPSEKKLRKKARKKEKKALKKQKKEERLKKRRPKRAKKPAARAAKPKKRAKKAHKFVKKQAEKLAKGSALRALMATVADYDRPYLKLIKIKKLRVRLVTGGSDPAEVAKNHARANAALCALLPLAMSALNIKKLNLRADPDFVRGESALYYDAELRMRLVKLAAAAAVFYKGFKRNQKIYAKAEEQEQARAA